jgi:hypothetical protein
MRWAREHGEVPSFGYLGVHLVLVVANGPSVANQTAHVASFSSSIGTEARCEPQRPWLFMASLITGRSTALRLHK